MKELVLGIVICTCIALAIVAADVLAFAWAGFWVGVLAVCLTAGSLALAAGIALCFAWYDILMEQP